MTILEKKLLRLSQELYALKSRVEGLVPLDTEGEYKKTYLAKIERARKSKTRFSFNGGTFSTIK